MTFTVEPIGYVRGARRTTDDDYWGDAVSTIELTDPFTAECLAGLDDFSHVEIVFVFDRVAADAVEMTARHPRNRDDWPLVGIFGQRGKRRPNRLGVSRATVRSIDGTTLTLGGLDAIDGTPFLDIKPWMDEFGPRGTTHQPAWATELMTDYYKNHGARPNA